MSKKIETIEERGAKASQEIEKILKKYHLALAVDIEGAQPFIQSLKPTLVEAPKENA